MNFLDPNNLRLVKPKLKEEVEGIICDDVTVEEAKYIVKNKSGFEKVMLDAKGVGIAAPQVGIKKKFFFIRMGDHKTFPEEGKLFFNAKYMPYDEKDVIETNEGCLSYKDRGRNNVFRFRNVKLQHEILNKKGDGFTKVTESFENCDKDFLGVVIQHETDHLYGITIFHKV